MSIFIELTTDPFDAKFEKMTKNGTTQTGKSKVRRPMNGLEIKEDTYAYLKLVRVNGDEIELLDSGSKSGFTTEYSNFILQSVSEQLMERHQIIETFGDTYLFLFGDAPRFLQVSAVVLNSHDFNWKSEFLANYRKYLRGTKAIEQGARTYLHYDTNIVEGYILNASVNESSDNPMMIPIQFQLFVTNSEDISVTSPNAGDFPIRASAVFPDGLSPKDSWSQAESESVLLQGGTTSGSFSGATIRTIPVRSKISDNVNEFTTPLYPGSLGFSDILTNASQKTVNDQEKEVENLATALGDALSSYGADDDVAYSPETADRLGYAPTFLPGGVGVGTTSGGQPSSTATMGASNPPSEVNGGFAGMKTGASRGSSTFQQAYSSISASTGAGASAGDRLGSGAFFDSTRSFSSNMSLAGSGVARRDTTKGASSNEFKNITSRSSPKNASAYAQAAKQGKSYVERLEKATAQAGGYTGANAHLGFKGMDNYVGASSAGNTGYGASISVGGSITAFSFSSISGELKNIGVSPKDALVSEPKSWNWSGNNAWPHGE